MSWPSWEEVLLRLQPIDLYREIREDLIDIYIEAYQSYPEAQESYHSEPISSLQRRANEQATAARNYDPNKVVHETQQFFGGLYKIAIVVVLLSIVISGATGGGIWFAMSRGAFQFLKAIPGLAEIVISGPMTVAVGCAALLIYFRLLTFNTFIAQTLNRELVMGANRTNTRNRRRLVGYLIWNSALNGGKGIHLLTVFSILKLLSEIHGVDLYKFTCEFVENNVDSFIETNGYWDGVRMLFARRQKAE